MAMFNIFSKNLKTVSRNLSYFFVLLICPAILILVAGGMLNSFDTGHIYIGVHDTNGDGCRSLQEMALSTEGQNSFGKALCYSTLKTCIDNVANSKVGACLDVVEYEDHYQVEVYLDSSRRLVEYYSKQMILEQYLGTQTDFVEQTSQDMQQKIILYSGALVDTKADLQDTLNDLNEQESLLEDRRTQLTVTRNDFDSVYYPVKNMEPELRSMRNDLVINRNNLDYNLNNFKTHKDSYETRIANLKNFLSSRLESSDYSYASSELDSMLADLNQIEYLLDNFYSVEQVDRLIYQIDTILDIIPKLDRAREGLVQADQDLGDAIVKTRESRDKVNGYIGGLEYVTKDLASLNERVGAKTSRLEFKEYFSLSNNPVLVSFPLLVSIIITFTSLVLSNLFILRQVSQPSYFRELISPTRDTSFLVADYLINLFFVAVQSVVLFFVGISWIGIPAGSVFAFAFSVFLCASLFIFVGMSLGYLIKSQSLSMLLTIFLVMLFFVISDLLVPTPLISPTIRLFVDLNPFVILSNILKHIFVLQRPLNEIYWMFAILGFFLFFSIIAAYISRKINKRRSRD